MASHWLACDSDQVTNWPFPSDHVFFHVIRTPINRGQCKQLSSPDYNSILNLHLIPEGYRAIIETILVLLEYSKRGGSSGAL